MIDLYDEHSEAYVQLRKEHLGNAELLSCVGLIFRLRKEIELIELRCEKLRGSMQAEMTTDSLVFVQGVLSALSAQKLIKASEHESAIWQASILIDELPEAERDRAKRLMRQCVTPALAESLVAGYIEVTGRTDAKRMKEALDIELAPAGQKITENQIKATDAHKCARRNRAPRGIRTYQRIENIDGSTTDRLMDDEKKR